MIILLIVLLLLFGGGWGGWNRWGPSGGLGIVGLILIVMLLFYFVRRRPLLPQMVNLSGRGCLLRTPPTRKGLLQLHPIIHPA